MKTFMTHRNLIATLAILALLVSVATLVVFKLLNFESYKEQILAAVSSSLKREVQYERGEVSFRFGPSFTFTKVIVKDRGVDRTLFSADRLSVKIALLPLLQKNVVIKDLILDKPRITIYRDATGKYNISDLFEQDTESTSLQLKGIRVNRGNLTINDLAVGDAAGVTTIFNELDIYISHLVRGKSCNFKISSVLAETGKPGIISLSGMAKLAPPGKTLDETSLNATIRLQNIRTDHFWPYYSKYVPFRQIFGQLDIDGTFKGKLREFTSKGKVKVAGLRFHYPQIFKSLLAPNSLGFTYDFELSPNDVAVKSIDLTVDGLNIKGNCSIKDFLSSDPRIVAKAITTQFDFDKFNQYIPYGIIVKDTADFIEQHIKGGIFKLDDGRLDGKVSQILHMERGENYNILTIKSRVEKGLISYGASIPTFNSIKGLLELRGKDFILSGMAGNFGNSPFTLDGKITDYPLDSPSTYPFSMIITPRQTELTWLMGKKYGARYTLNGDSIMHLSGSGGTSLYQLTGDWNLTPASYSYPDLIAKPAGRPNNLNFSGTITKKDAKLAYLQYNLAPLSLSISGGYRYGGKNPLTLDIKSNQVQLNDLAPILPIVKKYQATGRIQAAVHCENNEKEADGLFWRGQVILNDFSSKIAEQIKNISNVNGAITFNGTTLETSQLTARLGNSIITGKGKLAGFNNPALSLTFAAPRLDLTDLGFRPTTKNLSITDVQGSVVLKDNNLQIKYLASHLNKSFMQLKGNILNLRNPKIDLAIKSSYLDLNDLLLLTDLQLSAPPASPSKSRPNLTAKIIADTGKGWGIEFEQLRGTILLEENILYLQPMEMFAMGGKISARVRIDNGANGTPPRYQVSCSMNKVAAEKFVQAIGINSQEIVGTLSLQAELTGKGESADELKKSALGSLRLRIEEGNLRRFAVLSKIFSILNVSQLIKLQLPEMVSGGMPYHDITASFSIRDGIVTSKDLFISSDSMNISAIGKVNLVKNEMDITIGVQPLQTVDKVISRLPIVGWVLTGRDRNFITAYFEAKGKLDDPTVSAIPVKSIARGVFDIFKRVFELPGRLITDTGEVIIGK